MPRDIGKDVPTLKLNTVLNEKSLDNLLSGRRHLDKAYNKKNQVIVTHDTRNNMGLTQDATFPGLE